MKRHLIVVQDHSASIRRILQDVIGGLDTFFQEQRETDDEVIVWLHEFDTLYNTVFDGTPLEIMPGYQPVPRGNTALYDAVGRTVKTHADLLKKLPEAERPDKVQLVIVTDGEENSSMLWTSVAVRKLVQKVTRPLLEGQDAPSQIHKRGWDVFYIGAGDDALIAAERIGVPSANSLAYDPTGPQTNSAYDVASAGVSRSSKGAFEGYTTDERASTRAV